MLPQGLPDAPNRPNFPSAEIRPGVPQRGRIEYRFSVED
jgi:galactose mutarotase-like enzyme